jgi:hypothetical protein
MSARRSKNGQGSAPAEHGARCFRMHRTDLPKPIRRVISAILRLMEIGDAEQPIRDESALLCFSQAFVDLLAQLDAKSLSDVARRWQRQLQRRKVAGWSEPFDSRVLRGIAIRARKVRARGPQLFVWVSP